MTHEVVDTRSNPIENIKHAATVIQKSKHRRLVFEAVYSGQKPIKTPEDIAKKTKLEPIRITQEATILYNNGIITRTRIGPKYVYGKDKFFKQYKNRILSLAKNKSKLSRLSTKSNPVSAFVQVKIPVPKQKLQDIFITVDDIDSFSKVKKIKNLKKIIPIRETQFKEGIQNILNEKGKFKDWGGEKNDLLSTRVIIGGKRRNTAFAFKGRGIGGTLMPNRMGKNGDQIQRLFESSSDVFLVQYWNRIGEKIIEQMKGWAQLKSLKDQKKIYYGIIDGNDTVRLCEAYKNKFPNNLV